MAGAGPAEAGRSLLPLRVRLAYSSASVSSNALSQAWGLWLLYFYAPPADATHVGRLDDAFGLDARVLAALLLTASRLVEALDDPLIGYWTDRTSSRWGRRIPFIVLGTPLWGLLFFLLFTPPEAAGSGLTVAYVLVVAWAFYMLSNLAGAPLEALLPQLARTNADRVSVATWQVVFGVIGAAVGLSLSSLLREFLGFAPMAAIIALIAVSVRLLALGGSWRYALADREPAAPGFVPALHRTFTNRQFLAFLPSFVLFQVGAQLLIAALPFYVDTVLHASSLFGWSAADDAGLVTFVLTVAVLGGMLAAIRPFGRLAGRVGKANAYRVAMLGAAGYFPLLFAIGLLPGLAAGWQAVLAVLLAGVPTAGVYLFPNIITADIIDDDAARGGTRREAMYYGAQNLVEKLATALAPLLFALVLLAGDSAANPTGVRLVGPLAGVLVLVGYLAFRAYTLDGAPRAGDGRA